MSSWDAKCYEEALDEGNENEFDKFDISEVDPDATAKGEKLF
jgi:hypothetical protein